MAANDLPVTNDNATNPSTEATAVFPISDKGFYVDRLLNGAVLANTWYPSNYFGAARGMQISAVAIAAATLTFEVSYDNIDWFAAYTTNTNVVCSFALSAAGTTTDPAASGSITFPMTPAPYYRVKSSAATTIKIINTVTY